MIFSLMVSVALAADLSDTEYQRRLQSLKESQAQTQAYLNRLGFSQAPSNRGNSNEENSENEKPLIKVHSDLKLNRIKTGSVYRGLNQNRLLVGGEVTPAIIELGDDQGNLSGLKLMAQARPSATNGRIHLEVNRLVLRNGRVVPVQAVAMDTTGALGLHAHVMSGKALAIAGSLAASFVAGVAAAKQTQATNAFGFYQNQQTGRNAVLGGVAQTAADQSKRLIEESTAEKPVLLLSERTPMTILFQEEVRF